MTGTRQQNNMCPVDMYIIQSTKLNLKVAGDDSCTTTTDEETSIWPERLNIKENMSTFTTQWGN